MFLSGGQAPLASLPGSLVCKRHAACCWGGIVRQPCWSFSDPAEEVANRAPPEVERLKPPGRTCSLVCEDQFAVRDRRVAINGDIEGFALRSVAPNSGDSTGDVLRCPSHSAVLGRSDRRPAIPPRCTTQGGIALATDPDRNPGTLDWKRAQSHAVSCEVPPAMINAVTGQQRHQQFQTFVHDGCARTQGGGLPESRELLGNAAQSDAERNASATETIQAGQGERQHLRSVTGQRGNPGPEPYARGDGCHGRERDPGIQRWHVPDEREVVPHEEPIPAGLFRRVCHLEDNLGVRKLPQCHDLDTEAHRPSMRSISAEQSLGVPPSAGRCVSKVVAAGVGHQGRSAGRTVWQNPVGLRSRPTGTPSRCYGCTVKQTSPISVWLPSLFCRHVLPQ